MSSRIRNLNKEEINSLIDSGVWNEACPVHYSKLKVVEVQFFGFCGDIEQGKMMVFNQYTANVQAIFAELFDLKFPIAKMNLMDIFLGDDLKSMEENNSSGFNGRKIMGTDRWSSHSYGLAIDINPQQNPYLKLDLDESTIEVFPTKGISFVNRRIQKPGMVEEIVPIFTKYGFTEWGGNWELKPDYHHFQIPWKEIHKLFSV